MYVWVCMYRYIGIILRTGFFLALSLFFLFCVPHSCLPTVSLEVDVQTLKPPGAKPRTGKYVRVGYKIYIKKKKKKKKKKVVPMLNYNYYNEIIQNQIPT